LEGVVYPKIKQYLFKKTNNQLIDQITHFNIRVYGLIFNEKKELLLTDEFRLGIRMTKFPGGGLKFGEGTIDCLKREIMEEIGQDIEIVRHFYTTDYFQPTMHLKTTQQLISIYYCVKLLNPNTLKVSDKPFDFKDKEGAQSFRWVSLERINEKDLTFPIDKHVLQLLKAENRDLPR